MEVRFGQLQPHRQRLWRIRACGMDAPVSCSVVMRHVADTPPGAALDLMPQGRKGSEAWAARGSLFNGIAARLMPPALSTISS